MKISELPYQQNSAKLFSLVADEPWSIFFDSGFPEIDMGRYDIIVSRPAVTLETYGNITHINDDSKIQMKVLSVITKHAPFWHCWPNIIPHL